MNKRTVVLLVGFGLFGLASFASWASDGSISITGNLKTATCSISQADLTVPLPPVTISDLSSAGSVAGKSNFKINYDYSVCGSKDTSIAGVYFEPGPNVLPDGGLKNTAETSSDGAKGVELQLLYKGQLINPTTNGLVPLLTGGTAAPGNGIWLGDLGPFDVQYYAKNGNVAAGKVVSNVQFTIAYN